VSEEVITTIDALSTIHKATEPIPPDEVIDKLRASWQEVIHHIQVRAPGGVQVVKDATPVELHGSTIVLAFTKRANVGMLDNPKRREVIEIVLNKVLGVPTGTYKCKGVDAATPSAPVEKKPAKKQPEQQAIDDASPILDAVIDVFGGKIIVPEDEKEED
jgi:hypothetical protein